MVLQKLLPIGGGEIIAKIDQSYVGLDVEIGDADNDGKNEILTVSAPDSRLYLFKKKGEQWKNSIIADRLAQSYPGLAQAVKVVDLNLDGKNEVICGTGQLTGGIPALFYFIEIDGLMMSNIKVLGPMYGGNYYTHGFAMIDMDKDGLLEVISSYCGGGEVIRYDVDKNLTGIEGSKIYQVSGSGEGVLIADVDNDGKDELLVVNAYREDEGKVEIFEFDDSGLVLPPRHTIDCYDGKKCFYASIAVGDIDNDNKSELVIAWKKEKNLDTGTVIGYKVDSKPEPVYSFSYEDEMLDTGFFENSMVIADADNDGMNELVLATQGNNTLERKYSSRHLGHVFLYKIEGKEKKINRKMILDFNEDSAWSSWVAVGDADNDGKNEIVLASGKGARDLKGTSYLLMLKKK